MARTKYKQNNALLYKIVKIDTNLRNYDHATLWKNRCHTHTWVSSHTHTLHLTSMARDKYNILVRVDTILYRFQFTWCILTTVHARTHEHTLSYMHACTQNTHKNNKIGSFFNDKVNNINDCSPTIIFTPTIHQAVRVVFDKVQPLKGKTLSCKTDDNRKKNPTFIFKSGDVQVFNMSVHSRKYFLGDHPKPNTSTSGGTWNIL